MRATPIALSLALLVATPADGQWYPADPFSGVRPWQPYPRRVRPARRVHERQAAKPRPARQPRQRPRYERREAPIPPTQDAERNAIQDRVLEFCRRYPKDTACAPPTGEPQ